jgi:hypothetical protein
MVLFTKEEYDEVVPHLCAGDVDACGHWLAVHLRSKEAFGQFMFTTAHLASFLIREQQQAEHPGEEINLWTVQSLSPDELDGSLPHVQAFRMVVCALNRDEDTLFALVLAAVGIGAPHATDVVAALSTIVYRTGPYDV